jgi:hypothetical protein
MKNFLMLWVIVVAMALLGCPDNSTTQTSDHVYIAGQVGTASDNCVPVYWKDGALNYFPLHLGNTNGWTGCIAVDSLGTVYAQGGQWGSTSMHGYWKGSTFIELSFNSYTKFWYQAIAVDSTGDVWLAAILDNSSPPTIPVYWKNSGSPSSLSDCTNIWGVAADTLGNVYFMGTIGGTNVNAASLDYSWTPAYWKNGPGGLIGPTSLQLSGSYTNGCAGPVAVDAEDNFYTCGAQWSDTADEIVYWKNNETPIALSKGAYGAYAWWGAGITAVDASGKLYFLFRIGTAGPEFPVYWNGATSDPAALLLGGNSYWNIWNEAGAVDAQGNFIVVGSVGSSSATTIPVYWENGGSYVELPMGSGNTFGQAHWVAVGP